MTLRRAKRKQPAYRGSSGALVELLFGANISELPRRRLNSEGPLAGNVHSHFLLHDALHAAALHGQLLGDGG